MTDPPEYVYCDICGSWTLHWHQYRGMTLCNTCFNDQEQEDAARDALDDQGIPPDEDNPIPDPIPTFDLNAAEREWQEHERNRMPWGYVR